MATALANLVVSLEANASKLTAGLGKAENAVRSSSARINRGLAVVDRGFNNVTRTVSGVARRMLSFNAIVGTLAGTAGLGLLAKRSLDAADAIAKTADRTGISTDALQEYRFAADRAGVSTQTLDSGFEAFTKRIGELRAGTGALNTILKKIDPTFAEMVRGAGSTEEALDLVLGRMASLENASDRAALSAAAFGRTAGVEMANLVKDGAGALEEMRQRARDLGLVIEEQLLRQAESAKDRLTDLGTVIETKVTAAMVRLAPQIDNVAGKLLTLFERVVLFFDDSTLNRITRLQEEIAETESKIQSFKNVAGFDLTNTIFDEGLRNRLAAQREELGKLQDMVREAALLNRGQAGPRPPAAIPAATGQAGALSGAATPAADLPLQTAQIDTYNAALERSRQLFDATRLPMELYQIETQELDQLLAAGTITQETYNRALEASKERLAAAQARQADFGDSTLETNAAMREFENIANSASNQFAGSLADAAIEGRKLGGAMRDLASDIAKAIVKALILRAVLAFAGSFDGGGVVAAATVGGASGLGQGGATLRFHKGGEVPGAGAVPVIAHAGEGIFTPKQMENADRLFRRMADNAGSGLNVTVVNNTGDPVQASQVRRTPNGDIEVQIDKAVGRALRGGGDATRAALGLFGGGLAPVTR